MNRLLHTASTLNPREIAHFSRLSASWWNESGEMALLHRMNPLRVKYIRDRLVAAARDDGDEHRAGAIEREARAFKGMEVLDVGCGGGLLSESLARLGARTLGVDLAESNIGVANTHAAQDPQLAVASQSGDLEYRHVGVESLVDEPRRFDVVCALEVVEHVENPALFLRSSAELVKPGGHLFLSTIARTPLAHFLTIFMAEDVLRLVPRGTHTYNQFINPDEIVDFFHTDVKWISALYDGVPPRDEAQVRGIGYLPWMGTWSLLPQYVPGSTQCNYLFWARKPHA